MSGDAGILRRVNSLLYLKGVNGSPILSHPTGLRPNRGRDAFLRMVLASQMTDVALRLIKSTRERVGELLRSESRNRWL